MLIEEAAGLGKHRKRRRKAQLKLERTQDNLDRALDVEREARTRLKPLKRQAEAAELHERIERQSDEARWTLARDNSRSARAGLETAEKAVAEARAAAAAAEEEFTAVGARRAKAEEALSARGSERETLSSRFYSAKSSGERVGMRLDAAQRLIGELQERITRREGGIAALQAEIEADTGDDGAEDRIAGLQRSWKSSRRTIACGWSVSSPSWRRGARPPRRSWPRRPRWPRPPPPAAPRAKPPPRPRVALAASWTSPPRRPAASPRGSAPSWRRSTSSCGRTRALRAARRPSPTRCRAAPGYELALSAALGPRLRAGVALDLESGAKLLSKGGKDGAAALIVPDGGRAARRRGRRGHVAGRTRTPPDIAGRGHVAARRRRRRPLRAHHRLRRRRRPPPRGGKRGKGQQLIPLEELRTEERSGMEPADPLTAERIYERRWASTLLDRVLSRLEDTYRKRGNAALFDSFNQLLADEPGAPSQADIAAQLGMTENAVSQAYHRFRQSYQSLLREEIAHTVATPGDIENELRYLIAVIRA